MLIVKEVCRDCLMNGHAFIALVVADNAFSFHFYDYEGNDGIF